MLLAEDGYAQQLAAVVAPVANDIEVLPLTDDALWGRQIEDERYLLVVRP